MISGIGSGKAASSEFAEGEGSGRLASLWELVAPVVIAGLLALAKAKDPAWGPSASFHSSSAFGIPANRSLPLLFTSQTDPP